jgi:hypothetical protein
MTRQSWIFAGVLVGLGIATWIVKGTLWWSQDGVYYSLLYSLAIASVFAAAAIVRTAKRRWLATSWGILGLAIGQVWLLKSWFAKLTWAINGFAP